MNRPPQIWIGIAVVAFCLGIAIGRFTFRIESVPKPVAANPAAGSSNTNPAAPEGSSSKKARRSEPASAAEVGDDVYSQIKGVLESNGTSRLYDSFGKISQLIDQNNVRDVLAFAEKISKKEQKDALTLLVLARWAEFDPQAALTFAQNISASQSRTWALVRAVSGWAQRDSVG